MRREEAANEAIRRWGPMAYISDRHWREDVNQRFLVTDCRDECGVGATWEEAFAQADKRKAELEGK